MPLRTEAPTAQANEPMAVSGIESLPPITVKLRNELLAALNMTDKADELCRQDCSPREFVAALAPAQAAAFKLQDRLPADDPRRALLVNIFDAYSDTAVEMRKKRGGEDRVQRLSGEAIATLRMAGLRKILLTQVLDEHMTTHSKLLYYGWRDEPDKAQAVRDKEKEAERQRSQEMERMNKQEEAFRLAEVMEQRRIESAKKSTEADVRVLKFQQQKAAEGYGGAQYELGLRYLHGKGVETNRDLAIQWLNSACTNGLSEATNALSKIQ